MFWKTLFRPAQILIPFFLGLCCPSAAKGGFAVKYLLVLMLLNACLGIRLSGLKVHWFHIRVLIANVLMGVVPWLIGCAIFGHDSNLTKTLFYTGIAPTATSAPVIISFLGGEIAPVLTGFIVSDLGISVLLVFLLPFVAGQTDFSFVLDVLQNILVVMGIPLVVSRILLRYYPSLMRISKEVITPHALWAWSIMLFVLGGLAGKTFRENAGDGSGENLLLFVFCSLLIAVLNFTIGHYLGKGKTSYEIEASQMLGQKNTMFIIFLALEFSGPIAAIGPLCYILWHNGWNAIQLWMIAKKMHAKEKSISC